MITKCKVFSGYASKLPLVKDRVFEFSDSKINVIFGENGCGKSSIIKIMAAYCSIINGGWTRYLTPPDLIGAREKETYPAILKHIAPGDCEAAVEWDGHPTCLLHMEDNGRPAYFADDESGSSDGVTDFMTQVSMCVNKPSQGQIRVNKLLKLKDLLRSVPDPTRISDKYYNYDKKGWCVNNVWQKVIQESVNYLSSLPKNGRPTLLLDEPDKSLSIDLQIGIWTHFIPNIAKHFQVIVTTHCFAPLLIQDIDFNFVEMKPGYVQYSRDAIIKLVK